MDAYKIYLVLAPVALVLLFAFYSEGADKPKAKRKGIRHNNHKRGRKKKTARSLAELKHAAEEELYREFGIYTFSTPAKFARFRARQRANGYASHWDGLRPPSERSSTATPQAPARPKNARAKTS
jgi:hypothetical protein